MRKGGRYGLRWPNVRHDVLLVQGRVGRTLALLNVAYEIAHAELKVLVVDFDLEAPAIHVDRWKASKNQVSMGMTAAISNHPGLVEYVGEYIRTMRAPKAEDHIVDATPGGCEGEITVMPSGRVDDSYSRRLNEIDWNDLYRRYDGYLMFEDMRVQWEALGFDYVLIDSRTGFTDVGGICTRHLPDAVVTMFRPDDQSLRGMKEMVRAIRSEKPTPRRKHPMELHFVMAAIPNADDEDGILEEHRRVFQEDLGIPRDRLLEIRHYQSMDLLTQPVYTRVRRRTALARSYQELTKRIRTRNVEDRDGVLGYLRDSTVYSAEQRHDAVLDRIEDRYGADVDVLAELAEARYGSGAILDAADLFERIALRGPLSRNRQIRLAQARHITHDHEGASQALRTFFQTTYESAAEGGRDFHLVLRGLNMLEALGQDRASYVAESPTVAGLEPSQRAVVAGKLDRSLSERKVAIVILKVIIGNRKASVDDMREWKWALAFAQMATGDFNNARQIFGQAMDEAEEGGRMPTAFNLAMAEWAETGEVSPELFERVLNFYDSGESHALVRRSANDLQALAVAEWFGDRVTDANRHLEQAEQAIQQTRSEISCWSYTRVPRAQFMTHCDEMRKLFSGEDIEPNSCDLTIVNSA